MEDKRIDQIINSIEKIARGDYSVLVELSDKNDEIDSIAIGINMLVEEIKSRIEDLREANEKLKEAKNDQDKKIHQLEVFQKATVDRELKMRELKETIEKLEEKIRYLESK